MGYVVAAGPLFALGEVAAAGLLDPSAYISAAMTQ
jgi:hypothetical protein